MDDRIAKSVKVLSRIRDYFMEAIDKYGTMITQASKDINESLKRIRKDLETLELGKLPASETTTSTAVLTTVLAKRGEVMSPQELWSSLHSSPITAPTATPPSEQPLATPPSAPPSGPPSGPPSAPPSGPPSAPPAASVPPSAPPTAPQTATPPVAAPPSMSPGEMMVAAVAEEETGVGGLKSEMLKELKKLKTLMSGGSA
ncbi:MAG: hypothetical protein ACFE7E_05390 [Candidatus Hodarchaeota archaeon]